MATILKYRIIVENVTFTSFFEGKTIAIAYRSPAQVRSSIAASLSQQASWRAAIFYRYRGFGRARGSDYRSL